MDIRSSLDGLKTLLGVSPTTTTAAQKPRGGQAQETGSLTSDQATLSNAGSEVSQTAFEGGVRTEKVAQIQSALQAGTYNGPSSAVGAKMVDAMLGGGK